MTDKQYYLRQLYLDSKYRRRNSSIPTGLGLSLTLSSSPADLQSEYNAVVEELADVQDRLKNRSRSISSEVPIEEQRRNIEEFRDLIDREAKLRRQLNELAEELKTYPKPVSSPVSRGRIIKTASAQEISSIVKETEKNIKTSQTLLSFDQSERIAELIQAGSMYKLKTEFESFAGAFARGRGVVNYNRLKKDDAEDLITILEDKLDEAEAKKEEKEKLKEEEQEKKEAKEKLKEEEISSSAIRKAHDLVDSYKKYYSDLSRFIKAGDYDSAVECYSDMEELWYDLEELDIPPMYRFMSGIPSPFMIKSMFSIDTLYEVVRSGIKTESDIEELEESGGLTGRLKSLTDRVKSIRV